MKSPKIEIAIGIPAYRSGPSIEFCLQSAINQSRPANQIVLGDNCVDRDAYTISRWKRYGINYINSGVNIGGLANFFRVWEQSTCRYFLWLADDDFLHPESLAVFESLILKDAQKDIVAWCGLPTVHCTGQGSRISGSKFKSIIGSNITERLELLSIYGQWNFPFYSLYDKSLVSISTFKRMSLWPLGDGSLDWDWSFYVASLGSIRVVSSQLYFYNQDNWSNPKEYTESEIRRFESSLLGHPDLAVEISEVKALSFALRKFIGIHLYLRANHKHFYSSEIFRAIFLAKSSQDRDSLLSAYLKLGISHKTRDAVALEIIIDCLFKANPNLASFIESLDLTPSRLCSELNYCPSNPAPKSIWDESSCLRRHVSSLKSKLIRLSRKIAHGSRPHSNYDIVYWPKKYN